MLKQLGWTAVTDSWFCYQDVLFNLSNSGRFINTFHWWGSHHHQQEPSSVCHARRIWSDRWDQQWARYRCTARWTSGWTWTSYWPQSLVLHPVLFLGFDLWMNLLHGTSLVKVLQLILYWRKEISVLLRLSKIIVCERIFWVFVFTKSWWSA